MATSTTILIVDSGELRGGSLRAAIAAHGGCVDVAAPSGAAVLLAAGGYDAVAAPADVVDDTFVAAVRAAGAELLLACERAAGAPELERAMALGCDGVVAADASPAALRGLLRRVADRRARVAGERDELLRLRQQAHDARARMQRQDARLHDHQETFFLDLSRLMTIITNIMDGIVFVDRGGNVTLMNPVAEDLLGAKSFVAIGKPVAALQGRRELLQAVAADHARMDRQREASQTVEVHHDAQDLMYIKCMTSRVLDWRGQPAGVLTVLRDVTAEHKTDQLRNQYLSIVAHELRTPLTGIKTFATMMAKGSLGALNDRQQRVCDSIREQSVRLEHQIDKLINLGNLESSEYGQDRDAFPVAEFAAGLLAPFEQPARDRGIALTFDVEGDDLLLQADRSDLRRACQALVENAVKFTRDGGRVAVAIERSGDGLRFRVADDGIGVDPRYHRRIFEKFFQVEDPLTRHHGGAGLGLFVAKGIVEAHGSRIEVSSQLGQGADFSFALPVHRQGVPVHAGASDRPQGAQP